MNGTVTFCERFLNKRDRTYNRMVQGTRADKQNIIERNRDQADQYRLCQFGRATGGLPRLSPDSGLGTMDQGLSVYEAPSGTKQDAGRKLMRYAKKATNIRMRLSSRM